MLECLSHKIRRLKIYGDSEFVVKGVKGEYNIKKPTVADKNLFAKELAKKFEVLNIQHILRNFNEKADRLANEGLKKKNVQTWSGY